MLNLLVLTVQDSFQRENRFLVAQNRFRMGQVNLDEGNQACWDFPDAPIVGIKISPHIS